ncbi:hypothetical protein HDU77_005379 [Chytriomyces hyalinus]|nr:hypothetical protein HDU77_005379 [Chytriomyces hyalinus]
MLRSNTTNASLGFVVDDDGLALPRIINRASHAKTSPAASRSKSTSHSHGYPQPQPPCLLGPASHDPNSRTYPRRSESLYAPHPGHPPSPSSSPPVTASLANVFGISSGSVQYAPPTNKASSKPTRRGSKPQVFKPAVSGSDNTVRTFSPAPVALLLDKSLTEPPVEIEFIPLPAKSRHHMRAKSIGGGERDSLKSSESKSKSSNDSVKTKTERSKSFSEKPMRPKHADLLI